MTTNSRIIWNVAISFGLARSHNFEKPDRMVFDLDPGEELTWTMMREAACLTRTLFEELGLQCFVKTTGGNGLHIVVPLTPRDGWESMRDFSKAVADHLAGVIPNLFSAVSGSQNRVGKIFIDYIRNNRGATTVAAFSARARPGLGVSMPLSWDELPTVTGGAHWNIVTARERLESGADPWKNYATTKQTIKESSRKMLLHS